MPTKWLLVLYGFWLTIYEDSFVFPSCISCTCIRNILDISPQIKLLYARKSQRNIPKEFMKMSADWTTVYFAQENHNGQNVDI